MLSAASAPGAAPGVLGEVVVFQEEDTQAKFKSHFWAQSLRAMRADAEELLYEMYAEPQNLGAKPRAVVCVSISCAWLCGYL